MGDSYEVKDGERIYTLLGYEGYYGITKTARIWSYKSNKYLKYLYTATGTKGKKYYRYNIRLSRENNISTFTKKKLMSWFNASYPEVNGVKSINDI